MPNLIGFFDSKLDRMMRAKKQPVSHFKPGTKINYVPSPVENTSGGIAGAAYRTAYLMKQDTRLIKRRAK